MQGATVGSADADVWSLGVARPGELALYAQPAPPLQDGEFRVSTLFSGLSAGTEISFLRGTNPYLVSCWDEDLCVFTDGIDGDGIGAGGSAGFDGLDESSRGDGTGPDPAGGPEGPERRRVPGARASYPVRNLGYMECARVVESRSPAARVGDVVAMRYGHRTQHVAGPDDIWVPLPPHVDPLLGIYVAQMGPICANGLLHAAAQLCGPATDDLGDGVRDQRVLVIGAGVVGLLTALLAHHHGAAEVLVADPTPARLDAARRLGLGTVDERHHRSWRVCKEAWRHGPGDRGADLVFQCRGRTSCLADALRALRPQGTVIDLAFYQDGAADVHLGQEFHHNGLTLCSAQIARVPRGLAGRWNRRRLADETVDLLAAHGPAIREALVTDVVPFADAPRVVTELAERRRHAIQVVFAFPEEAELPATIEAIESAGTVRTARAAGTVEAR
jgi:NADPH:quinone reductase-like Zn-dependent oxidoreductase